MRSGSLGHIFDITYDTPSGKQAMTRKRKRKVTMMLLRSRGVVLEDSIEAGIVKATGRNESNQLSSK
jgi:hypothetical protein